jgi:secreted protein with Ig-like and vWFA domain
LETAFVPVASQPLSTFGMDVDTGSYANVRRFLRAGMFPPRAAVRVEEMINYFPYAGVAPRDGEVFGMQSEVGACPWEPRHRLVRVALRARGLEGERPPGNLVFLVDISGSMGPSDRLPLLKQALRALVKRLSAADRVAIVTYASRAGVHLGSTSCEEKDRILEAIDALGAGGSTNGEGGIREAYEVAGRHLIPGGVNRVLLCTDGDFNVGMQDRGQLVDLIAGQARSGVFLTTLGVGTDNFKDALMRQLADRGNGSYHYLDSAEEAQRVLLEQMEATFVTVARDAKIQVEFNPGRVAAWRLIGYEKRRLADRDFNDDSKDAGEVGAGQTVTVLYEIVPAGVQVPGSVDPLKYQPAPEREPMRVRTGPVSRELMTLKLRYQQPEGSRSVLREMAVLDREQPVSGDFRFAAAVAAFGMALRDPQWDGGRGFDRALELAQPALGEDPGGWRAEFLSLVRKARGMPRR